MSETHFSWDTVGHELRLAIQNSLLCPEMDRNIRIGKQGDVFILPILGSDVLMFHSCDINHCVNSCLYSAKSCIFEIN